MTCYICLEQGDCINMGGCVCKGSIVVHYSCFQELLKKSNNSFQCSLCKTDFSGTFINKFISAEEILFKSEEKNDIDDMVDLFIYNYNGLEIEFFEEEIVEELLFQPDNQDPLYLKINDTVTLYLKMFDKAFQDRGKEWKFNKKHNMRNIRSNQQSRINKQLSIKWKKK